MKLVDTSCGILYIGSKLDAKQLIVGEKSPRFDIIWNLAKELEFLALKQLRCSDMVLLGNIKDYDIPSDPTLFKEQLDIVINCLQNDGRVFIHCFGGCGRTGMALAAVKKTLDGMSSEDSILFAKEQCYGPELEQQASFIHSL